MAKTKTTFYCQNCGAQHTQWVGQCSTCKEWNTIVEEVIQKEEKRNWKTPTNTDKKRILPKRIQDIEFNAEERFETKNDELDAVLGGGLVKGAVVLLGGEPGIGKSTLLLQLPFKILSN